MTFQSRWRSSYAYCFRYCDAFKMSYVTLYSFSKIYSLKTKDFIFIYPQYHDIYVYKRIISTITLTFNIINAFIEIDV